MLISALVDASILVRWKDWSAFWEMNVGGLGDHGFFDSVFLTLDNFSLINYKTQKGGKMDLSFKRPSDYYYYLQAIHLCA